MWDAEGRFYPHQSPNQPLLEKRVGVVTEGRKFRDVIFAVLFILTFGGMAAISVFGFMKGNPSLLLPSNEYGNTNITETADYWFHDSVVQLKTDIDILGITLGVSFVLGLIWLQLMRMFTKVFIYLTAVVGILLVIAGGVVSFHFGAQSNNESLKIFSYCLFGLSFILVVALIFLRKKINLTAALFTECCRGVQHNPALLLVATVIFGVFTVFIAYWIASFLFLFSITDDSVQVQIPNTMPQFNTKVRNLLYFNLFGFYWTTGLLSAIFQMVIAGAISSWYFSRNLSQQSSNSLSVASTLGYALTKSLGSLAFGSLLLAIVQFFEFMIAMVKRESGNNKVLQYASRLANCFLNCVMGLLRWINKFAYITIAIRGDSFISSAKSTFDLISRNSFSAVVVDTLGTLVLFIGKLLGTSACTILALFALHLMNREVSFITMTAVIVISFLVFSLLANIVAVGVDTVLVCYLEDLESNGGNEPCIDPTLHSLLQEKAREVNQKNVN